MNRMKAEKLVDAEKKEKGWTYFAQLIDGVGYIVMRVKGTVSELVFNVEGNRSNV